MTTRWSSEDRDRPPLVGPSAIFNLKRQVPSLWASGSLDSSILASSSAVAVTLSSSAYSLWLLVRHPVPTILISIFPTESFCGKTEPYLKFPDTLLQVLLSPSTSTFTVLYSSHPDSYSWCSFETWGMKSLANLHVLKTRFFARKAAPLSSPEDRSFTFILLQIVKQYKRKVIFFNLYSLYPAVRNISK